MPSGEHLFQQATPHEARAIQQGSEPSVAPHIGSRLFCLPYAGGGTPVFRCWSEGLPDNVTVHPLELPGRGKQFTTPAARQLPALIATLNEAIRPYLDQPFSLFGHSMGALVSFELARAIRSQHGMEPMTLYVSAHPAAQLPNQLARLHDLSDQDLRTELRRLGGTPQEILANDEFMSLLLPTLRADFEVCETYDYQPSPPLHCPIVAFGGIDDPQIAPEQLEAWAEMTTGEFKLKMLPGDHFFIDHNRPALLAALSASLDLADSGSAPWSVRPSERA